MEREHLYRALGKRIKARREALDLSQEELATRIGMTRASVANIESGAQRLMLHSIPKVARALRWTPRKLLEW